MVAAGNVQSQNSANGSHRANCTTTHGPFEVGEFTICRDGARVALHLSTPRGRFIFHLGRGGFLAALDASGERLVKVEKVPPLAPAPSVEQVRESLLQAERADCGAGQLDDEANEPIRGINNCPRISRALREKRIAIYREFKMGNFPSLRAACLHHGELYSPTSSWLSKHADEVAREIAETGGLPLLKPGGRIL